MGKRKTGYKKRHSQGSILKVQDNGPLRRREERKEDRCRGRLKAMKPKLYSLHGLDSNHP